MTSITALFRKLLGKTRRFKSFSSVVSDIKCLLSLQKTLLIFILLSFLRILKPLYEEPKCTNSNNGCADFSAAEIVAYQILLYSLYVLRQSVSRVCEAHFCVIGLSGNLGPFEEMSQRWRAVGNSVRFDRPEI